MKKSIYILLFFSVITISLQSQQVYKHQFIIKVGDKAPDFEVKLIDGTVFKLSDQLGKVIMLQFTASWCSVCREEMPYIENDIWQVLKEKDFVLVGMDYKERSNKVREFAKQMKISYPIGMDTTGRVYHLFSKKGSGVTRNIIIDKNGEIIFLSRLFNLKEFEEMKTVIFEALK